MEVLFGTVGVADPGMTNHPKMCGHSATHSVSAVCVVFRRDKASKALELNPEQSYLFRISFPQLSTFLFLVTEYAPRRLRARLPCRS